ncbi:uncharacterized protein LOC116618490 isoform X3 [Nematostella vectensis]|uniref:uncharacterized protein LOC116618490 isoform X3 n=1 Tax=Nematostella vectensis TaxID=45351 RepID=UPI002076FF75|nr:uncharacterized protein LOC116618490 isoform X3 [Nematostella vectensis]
MGWHTDFDHFNVWDGDRFIALLLFDIITCLCNVAMVFLVSFKTCKEFKDLGLSCFKKWTVTYSISALIVAAAMIALLALVSAILAGIKINKLKKERSGQTELLALIQ